MTRSLKKKKDFTRDEIRANNIIKSHDGKRDGGGGGGKGRKGTWGFHFCDANKREAIARSVIEPSVPPSKWQY